MFDKIGKICLSVQCRRSHRDSLQATATTSICEYLISRDFQLLHMSRNKISEELPRTCHKENQHCLSVVTNQLTPKTPSDTELNEFY